MLQLCIKLKRNAHTKTMCLSCRVPTVAWREAAGQLRGPISLPEREKCRFSSLCQEGQRATWNRELQGLAGMARCHEGPPQPLHRGRMEIELTCLTQASGGYLKREYRLSQRLSHKTNGYYSPTSPESCEKGSHHRLYCAICNPWHHGRLAEIRPRPPFVAERAAPNL